jgi:hypothetical protein
VVTLPPLPAGGQMLLPCGLIVPSGSPRFNLILDYVNRIAVVLCVCGKLALNWLLYIVEIWQDCLQAMGCPTAPSGKRIIKRDGMGKISCQLTFLAPREFSICRIAIDRDSS